VNNIEDENECEDDCDEDDGDDSGGGMEGEYCMEVSTSPSTSTSAATGTGTGVIVSGEEEGQVGGVDGSGEEMDQDTEDEEDSEDEAGRTFEESSLECMVDQIERWIYLYGDSEEQENEGQTGTGTGSGSSTGTVYNTVGLEALFPPLDGTSFYRTICKINHSCKPNVRVQYSSFQHSNNPIYGGLIATMVALEDIEPQQELVQSYIDQYLPYTERKVALSDYGFLCRCERCKVDSRIGRGNI